MELKDTNDKLASIGDIFNLHQTVNGQSLFVIISLNPLDIRYAYDISRMYEYDKEELFKPSRFTGETETEIVGNIHLLLHELIINK